MEKLNVEFAFENLEVLKIAAAHAQSMEDIKRNYLELILLLQGTVAVPSSILQAA